MNCSLRRYIGTASFYRRALSIALPVMAQLLIMNLVSLIDNFMVAGLGDIKMSGVNIAGQINFVFMIFVNSICIAGGIFMSQFKGAQDSEGMRQTFKFKIISTGFFGILYALFCYAAPRFVFNLMVTVNADAGAILDQSQDYSRAVALSWVFMVFAQSIASSLREIEDVRPPLVFSTAAAFVNTFFNWVFIYGNLGAPRLEVVGAGIATCIARAVELLLFVIYLFVKRPPFVCSVVSVFKVRLNLFASIFRKTLVILYSEVFWAFSETFSVALYNTRGGAEVVSGMAAGFAIANLFFVCFSGIITSTGVIIGQELGANRLEESRRYKNWIITGSVVFGFMFTLLGFASILLIPFVFKNLTLEAQKIACYLVIIAACYLPLWALINSQYSVSRTGGDTKMGAVCDTVGNLLFVGGMVVLTFFTSLTPYVMYAIVKLSDIPKAAIAHFWLKKERWLINLADRNRQSN